MIEWVKNVPLQVNTTQYFKLKRKYLPESK